MAKNDNLKDFLVDLADTIREKKGISGPINPQDFASEIASIESGGGNGWTGHADAEGLRAIGWTDEDIAYYQENGVDWNEEDDHLHLVSDDNKALYGVLTADNISSYKDRIVYLPKIDTSKHTSLSYKFTNCFFMVAIPMLDTSKVANAAGIFSYCYSLRTIPPLDLSNATTLEYAFFNCVSLRELPLKDIKRVTNMLAFCRQCVSLEEVELQLDSVTTLRQAFYFCSSLQRIVLTSSNNVANWDSTFYCCTTTDVIDIDMERADTVTSTFAQMYKCREVKLKNVNTSINLNNIFLMGINSLLYIINNEAATSPITITLATNVYDKYATDPDVVEALSNHPNITLAK